MVEFELVLDSAGILGRVGVLAELLGHNLVGAGLFDRARHLSREHEPSALNSTEFTVKFWQTRPWSLSRQEQVLSPRFGPW